jgi:hypothetical protein
MEASTAHREITVEQIDACWALAHAALAVCEEAQLHCCTAQKLDKDTEETLKDAMRHWMQHWEEVLKD